MTEELKLNQGNIPVKSIYAQNIPEAFEKAMKVVWEEGCTIPTQYDKPGNPKSKDATVLVEIADPFSQPRFHRCFPGGIDDLGIYTMEVIHGAHDYWMAPIEHRIKNPSKDTKWDYTYHERLFEFPEIKEDGRLERINQIEIMINSLSQTLYTRRALAITYFHPIDNKSSDPPCLQQIWGRCLENENGELVFNMNTLWRSRDLYKAWFENVIALTYLQKKIAEGISEKIGKEVEVGRYVDFSHSLHIYGSYFNEFKSDEEKGVKGFFERLDTRNFEERTWTSDFARPIFIEGIEKILGEDKMPIDVKKKIKAELELIRNGAQI